MESQPSWVIQSEMIASVAWRKEQANGTKPLAGRDELLAKPGHPGASTFFTSQNENGRQRAQTAGQISQLCGDLQLPFFETLAAWGPLGP